MSSSASVNTLPVHCAVLKMSGPSELQHLYDDVLFQCLFLVYCMVPTSWNGSIFIYHQFIRPFVLKYQTKVDSAIEQMSDTAQNLLNEGNTWSLQCCRPQNAMYSHFSITSSSMHNFTKWQKCMGIKPVVLVTILCCSNSEMLRLILVEVDESF